MLLYILIIASTIILSETGAYLWHNFAHEDIALGVRETHKIHHNADLTHEAHEDFYWVGLMLFIIGCVLIYLTNYISYKYLLTFYTVLTIVFIWNWYIHSAYHISDHWLNQYDWFKKDKKIHFQHHINPRVNYGIASHFNDVIFGTYDFSNLSNLINEG